MNLISGALSGVLAVTGGLGISQISEEDTSNQDSVIQEQAIGVNQRAAMLDADEFEDMELFMEDGIINFGQMKPYMNENHSESNNQQLREQYKRMHGTGGSSQSNNFRMGDMNQ